MRIAICEDTFNHADFLRGKIERWAKSKKVQISIDLFPSAEEFLVKWPETRQFDLVFIDIQMKLLDGFELARIMRRHDEAIMIVFVTGFLDYVLHAYDVQALKYLIKPVRDAECQKVMDKAFNLYYKKKDEFLVISLEMQSTRIPLDDIYHFDIHSHYVDVHTKKGKITYKEKLKNLEQKLPSPHFFRCHRSCIVNLAHVSLINHTEAELDNGTKVPVAYARFADFQNAFAKYYNNTL